MSSITPVTHVVGIGVTGEWFDVFIWLTDKGFRLR
jgi:hypothetical protein